MEIIELVQYTKVTLTILNLRRDLKMNDGEALNPARIFFVVIMVVLLVFFLLVMKFFRIWLQAKLSHAEVKFIELVAMWLRKVDVRVIVLCRITAVQAGLDLTILELEAHYLARGNVARVVRALILAKRENIELSWKEATVIDLAGGDVLVEVQEAIEAKAKPHTNGLGENVMERFFKKNKN
jgi:uncharacterized protein YqfA (UPF0365 family)